MSHFIWRRSVAHIFSDDRESLPYAAELAEMLQFLAD